MTGKLSKVLDSLFPDPTRYHRQSGYRIRSDRRGGGSGGGRTFVALGKREKLAGIAFSAPEVMVKISKVGIYAKPHLAKAIGYISRGGALELTDQDGQKFYGKDANDGLAGTWALCSGMAYQTSRFSEAKRIVLSMPAGTPEDGFRKACLKMAATSFKGYDYVLAFHLPTNDKKTKQPHCHIIVRTLGPDGRRLHIDNAQRQWLRETFAACLNEHGIVANATPRWVRGKVHRSLSQSDYNNLKKASDKERARVFAMARKRQSLNRNLAARQKEVLDHLASGKSIPDAPGIIKAKARRENLTQLMKEAIAELSEGNAQDKQLAEGLKRHVNALPPVESIQQRGLRKLKEAAQRAPGKTQSMADRGQER